MPAPRIDKATVERMLLAYMVDPNPTHVARTCGVSWATAKQYITEGAPALGIGAFAIEARKILRAGDKIVRLTEVTKEIRIQVEEKDLGAYQDLLFGFEGMIHEAIVIGRARMARETEYYNKIADLEAKGAEEAAIAKVKKPTAANLNDLKAVAVSLHQLIIQKREFWDRLEIIRSVEVETGGGAEGLEAIDQPPAPDWDRWEPHEIAAYVDSVDAGMDPVYPSWLVADGADNKSMVTNGCAGGQGKSVSKLTEKEDQGQFGPAMSIEFPPGGEGE